MKNLQTVLLFLILFSAGFGAGFPWGMVMQFNKLSVPVMSMMDK